MMQKWYIHILSKSNIIFYSEGSIVADVQNFYEVSSNATTESVGRLIDKAMKDGIIKFGMKFTGMYLSFPTCFTAYFYFFR